MAEESETEQEPSIEEILASIRQIITDDEEEGEAAADGEEVAEPEPELEPEPEEPEEDVIELTEKVDDEPEEVAEPEPEPEEEPEPEPEEEVVEVDMKEPELEEELDSILTDNAETAALEAFAELASKTAVEPGGVTLEHIVRELIRPMLRQWVDKNLPPMVEKLLQQELEKIPKQAQDDNLS